MKITTTMTFTCKGPLFARTGFFDRALPLLLKGATEEVTEEVKNASIRDYLSKKKANPKLPSMIVESFTHSLLEEGRTQYRGVIFAGGVKAPWAIFVDQPHKTRGDSVFEGYFFMAAGIRYGATVVESIVRKHLQKIGFK